MTFPARPKLRLAALVLPFAPLFAGQDAADLFSKAPPDIDNALRERVTAFYQLHVEGKFRQADPYVAEDSKDAYFEAEKIRYRSFEIGRITYKNEDFTRALVALVVDSPSIAVPGVHTNIKLPLLSNWKVVDGKWYWFLEKAPPGTYRSLFGYLPIPKGAQIDAGANPASPAPNTTSLPTAASILNQVRLDRAQVRFLATQASSEQIKLTNSMPGPLTVRVELEESLPGLQAAFDKTDLNSQESATLTIQYEPVNAAAMKAEVNARIYVAPTGQIFPVKITFTK